MKLKKYHYITLIFVLFAIIFDFILFYHTKMFFFVLGLSLLILAFPFFFDLIYKTEKEKEKEEMFLEFLNDLAESVKTGTPISRSIINISKRNYKALDHHVKKLASQITIGIPLTEALEIFARDTKNKVIARAIELISQAERAGGKIESVLEASVRSVREIQEINKKRAAAIHNMVMQGYIIFFIFLIIMVVVQVKFIPIMLETLGGLSQGGYELGIVSGAAPVSVEFLNTIVFVLILIQSFFTGIVIGKLSEGKILTGLKHSFILIVLSFLILQGVKLFI